MDGSRPGTLIYKVLMGFAALTTLKGVVIGNVSTPLIRSKRFIERLMAACRLAAPDPTSAGKEK